jgi:hypothetical protein
MDYATKSPQGVYQARFQLCLLYSLIHTFNANLNVLSCQMQDQGKGNPCYDGERLSDD